MAGAVYVKRAGAWKRQSGQATRVWVKRGGVWKNVAFDGAEGSDRVYVKRSGVWRQALGS